MSENPKESREQQNHLATLLGGLGGFAAVLTVIIYSFVHPLLTALAGGENTGGHWWLLIFEGMFVVISCFWLIALVSPNRKEHLVSLQEEHLRQHYQQRLGKILDRLSHWFSKNINKNQHPVAYYWSADLWGFTLLVAVLYPFLSLLIQWLMGNQAAQLGGVVIFPLIEYYWYRWLIVCLLFGGGYSLYKYRKLSVNKADDIMQVLWLIFFSTILVTIFSIALSTFSTLFLWTPIYAITLLVASEIIKKSITFLKGLSDNNTDIQSSLGSLIITLFLVIFTTRNFDEGIVLFLLLIMGTAVFLAVGSAFKSFIINFTNIA
jgi:hypothetical protein